MMERKVFENYIQVKDGIEVIGHTDLHHLARTFDVSIKELERIVLDIQIVPGRYLANVKFFGIPNQLKLLDSKVAVIGCGAVGGAVCEALSRLGVGTVYLVDFDVFDETNLNRQLMCTEKDIGKSKVQCTKTRMESVNSTVTVIPFDIRLDEENALTLISGCDVVFDGLDNAKDKITLERACLSQNIPMIHGAISDSTFQVSTIKGRGILENIYAGGLENPVAGTPSCTAVACAMAEVGEALKLLLDVGDAMDGALLRYDWASWQSDVIHLF